MAAIAAPTAYVTPFAELGHDDMAYAGGKGANLGELTRAHRSAREPRHRGFSQAQMDIAVVVQRQIPSTRAGVMFTVDPAGGNQDQLVIEGSFGLGEAVVSGSVSPDRYVVRKSDLAITTRSVRAKELVIEPVEGGGTATRMLSPEESVLAVLDDEEVTLLAKLGLAIEEHYGSAQDTEWSFDPDGSPWMLQSRPITTLQSADSTPPAVLVRGLGAAPGRASGAVRVLRDPHDTSALRTGEVLVAHMTSPDWVPGSTPRRGPSSPASPQRSRRPPRRPPTPRPSNQLQRARR
jgi:pyruvate,water dikinase